MSGVAARVVVRAAATHSFSAEARSPAFSYASASSSSALHPRESLRDMYFFARSSTSTASVPNPRESARRAVSTASSTSPACCLATSIDAVSRPARNLASLAAVSAALALASAESLSPYPLPTRLPPPYLREEGDAAG